MKRPAWMPVRTAFSVFIALAMTQVLNTPAWAADYDVGSIHISAPWARATPKGATSGAAYVTIMNKVPCRIA